MTPELSLDRARLALTEALRELRSAPLVSAVAVLAVAASVSLIGIYVFVLGNTQSVLDAIARDLSARLYLDPDLAKPAIDTLIHTTAADPRVAEVTYRTADQERARVVQLLGSDLLSGLDEGAIPTQQTVEVRFVPDDLDEAHFEAIRALVDDLAQVDGVTQVGFEADHVSVIFAIGRLVEVTGSIVGLIALLVALAFVSLFVRLGLDHRDTRIALAGSFGATERFPSAPTLVSGLLIGIAGGLVAILIGWLVDGRLAALARTAPNFGVDLTLLDSGLVLWCLVGGVALALGGAWLSVRRHQRRYQR